MSPSDFETLFHPTSGGICLTDTTGHWQEFNDYKDASAHVRNNPECLVDLVTTDGEAIGVFVLGNGMLVDPQPSVICEDGMVYLFEGGPLTDQPRGRHVCPARLLDGASGGLALHSRDIELETLASKRQIRLMTGRRRDERQGHWKLSNSSFARFADELRVHRAGPKDGPSYLQGEAAEGMRKSAAQIANHILAVDLDSGAPLEDVIRAIQTRGLEAVIYTTHSHLKNITMIKRDHFMKVMKTDVPSPDLIRSYLIDAKGLLPHIVENIEVLDEQHTGEGVLIPVEHAPMPKFRAVFPLLEPFVFARRGGSAQDAIVEWKERYAGFCEEMGFYFDEACTDPARLFYFPRHDPKDTEFGSWMIYGAALDLGSFERVNARSRRVARSSSPSAATTAAPAPDYELPRCVTSDGFNLKRWAATHAKIFEVQTMLEEVVGGDMIRDPRSGKAGTHVECPFEAEHSSFGGNGTFVVNAGDNYEEGFEGGFAFVCQHNACASRDRLEFLKQLLDDGIISNEDLTNRKFLLEVEEEERPAPRTSNNNNNGSDASLPRMAPDRLSEPVPSSSARTLDEHVEELKEILNAVITPKGWRVVERPTLPGGDFTILTRQEAENRHAKRTVWEKDDKGKVTPRYPFKEWLESPDRRDFDGMEFAPGLLLKNKLNTFTGWPVPPVKGDYSLLKEHIHENICDGNPDYYRFFIEWFANIVQCPASKPGSAILISGDKGCGKSIALDYFQEIFGRYSVPAAHKNQLVGNFNGHLEGKLLMVGEELTWAEDIKAEGVLKDFITNTRMSVEKKGVDAAPSRNYTRLVLLSNSAWQVPATLRDERRFFGLRCSNGRQGDQAFFQRMREQMDRGGLGALMYDLVHYQPSSPDWSMLRKPPITPHLQTQQRASLDPISSFLLELIEHGIYEFERDAEPSIVLDDNQPTTVSAVHLRAAAREALKHEKVRINSPEISMRARQLFGARQRKEPFEMPDGNKRTEIIFPPLSECRRAAERFTGLPITAKDVSS